jgi:2-polyprenyl-3-methyl-5-hydroxy-6-metoxy-1,4-benzoquinol methylase
MNHNSFIRDGANVRAADPNFETTVATDGTIVPLCHFACSVLLVHHIQYIMGRVVVMMICRMVFLVVNATAFSAGRSSNSRHIPDDNVIITTLLPPGLQVQATHLHPQQQHQQILLSDNNQKRSDVFALTTCGGIADLPPSTNFLATQVWPSARVAAMAMERYLLRVGGGPPPAPAPVRSSLSSVVLCEFGCGPGLPSLAAAHAGAAMVYTTDIDATALLLVGEAARRQGLSHRIETRHFDLIHSYMDEIPHADIYLFSDVFENSHVAEGAARVAAELLRRNRSSKVWVFAQSDRSQRDVFLCHLRELVGDASLVWSRADAKRLFTTTEEDKDEVPWQYFGALWLCEIDETTVMYG